MQIEYKGATPIEKNVNVVDERGNVYEATYPKRAKGLVKNGRARFVDENTICLACPPNENLEDNKMSENTNINIEKITAREIWEQIIALQKQIESLADFGKVLVTIDSVDEYYEDGTLKLSVDVQVSEKKIDAMKTAFWEREKTLNSLLDFYKTMYNDVYQDEKKSKPESEAQVEKRNGFLKFVKETTIATAGAAQPGAMQAQIPDFEKLWKTVVLGE